MLTNFSSYSIPISLILQINSEINILQTHILLNTVMEIVLKLKVLILKTSICG